MGSELGATSNPRDLIPGDPDELDLLHGKLVTFSGGMTGAANKLRSIKSGDWKGKGGDAFRGLIDGQPDKFDTAGTSFQRAHVALSSYTRVLRGAQADAAKAIHLHGQGAAQTSTWKTQVTTYNNAVNTAKQSGQHPSTVTQPRPADTDPGAGDKAAAAQLLSDARGRVETEAKRLHGEVHDAADKAPKKPGLLHRALHALGSAFTFVGHAGEGIAEGVWGMAKGIWTLTGAAVTDPKAFVASWKGLGTLVDVFQPEKMGQAWKAFGKGFVDWDEWSKDPGRAFGKTLANIGSLALGGESLVGDAGEAGELGLAANAGKAGEVADDASMLQKVVDGANPKYDPTAQGMDPFNTNCTHCVQATALRLRGVDADARALPDELVPQGGRPSLDVIEGPWRTKFDPHTPQDIVDGLTRRGHGADGVVAVRWANGGGHVFNAVNVNGVVHFIDGQNGVIDASTYFSKVNPSMTKFAHLDGDSVGLSAVKYTNGLISHTVKPYQPIAAAGPVADYAGSQQ